nr:immunoglobulin light chain junction region [Macaca mulatta]
CQQHGNRPQRTC